MEGQVRCKVRAWLALAGVLGLGAWLRAPDVPRLLLIGDEFHSLWRLDLGYAQLLSTYDAAGSGLALPLLQRIASDLLGQGTWAFRLPALAGGLATLVLLFAVGQRLVGTPAALLATFALAVNAQQIFYSHFGRSYTLVTALSLVLVSALDHTIADQPLHRWWPVAAAGALGLLPWLHLTALALIVPAAAAAVLSVLGERQHRRRIRTLLVALAAGGVLAVALYVPAWPAAVEFARTKADQPYHGTFELTDIYAVLGGGRVEGAVLMLASVAGSALWLAGRRWRGLLLPAVALGIPGLVIVADPFGGPYAQARYMMAAVPFMLLLAAWLWARLSLLVPERMRVLIWGAGTLGVALSFLLGPRGPLAVDDGPFGNTYQAFLTVAPFDAPSPSTPPFYQALAGERRDVRIVEAPWLQNRGVRLYRNYYLQHRRETLAGFFRRGVPPGWHPSGAHVPLFGPDWSTSLEADYLIVHRDVRREVDKYWASVFGPTVGVTFPTSIAAFMEWNREPGLVFPTFSPRQEARLRRTLGEPHYEDRDLLVWRLGSQVAPTARILEGRRLPGVMVGRHSSH